MLHKNRKYWRMTVPPGLQCGDHIECVAQCACAALDVARSLGNANAKRGDKIRSGYLTPAFSGVPNKGDKIKVGPEEGGNATSPLHSRGSPTPSAGTKSEVATSPLPSRGPQQRGQDQSGPKRGRKCYITPAFSGVPNAKRGDKIKVGPKEGGDATSPLHSRGSPNKWGQNQNWRLNPAFWGTHKWAEILRQPCFLRVTKQRGQKQSTKKTKKTKTKNFPWCL